MKILHTVESYYPDVNGMAEVVKQLSSKLVLRGHDVTVATSNRQHSSTQPDGVKIIRYDISGSIARGISGNDIEKYCNLLQDDSFDIVTNFAAQQWATDLALPILKSIPAKKVFVPTGFSGLYSPVFKNYFKEMKTWMKQYDMNIFLSNSYRDINFALDNGINNSIVIPNGADKNEFLQAADNNFKKRFGIPDNFKLILSVGSHSGLKGHKEAIDIFLKAKLTNAALVIIGNNSKSRCYFECKIKSFAAKLFFPNKKIYSIDTDRATTISAYQAADVFLFPSNIECSPIVLFEAAASKTPFLATDVGNSREIVDWLKSGIILPTRIINGYSYAKILESAQVLEELLQNKGKMRELAEIGYLNWKKRFTWDHIAKNYEEVYSSLLKDR